MIIYLDLLTLFLRIFAKVTTSNLDRGSVHVDINYNIILVVRFVKPFFKVSKKVEWSFSWGRIIPLAISIGF